jgi:2-polyprenyl-6-methoxyphenol hydroxylase-like FAD-dependent oxidoreductase
MNVDVAVVGAGPAGSAAGTALGMESIREFRVESNAYSAEFGRNYGGQIAALTKSGTNTVRGSAYEFHRDTFLRARRALPRAITRRRSRTPWLCS